jgi:hypothetical protein
MNERQTSNSSLLIAVLVIVLMAGAGGYFLPVTGAEREMENHWRMAIAVAMTALMLGSALFFLTSLNTFKLGLRNAYRWFAAGVIVFGLGMLQWPVIVSRGLADSFWAVSGVVIIPFLCGTALMYFGMRQFAKLLNVRTVYRSVWAGALLVLDLAMASGILAYLLATNNTAGIGTETYTATIAWTTGFAMLAWWMLVKIRRVIGSEYRQPMIALTIGLGALILGGVHEFSASFVITEDDPYVYWGISMWPFVVAGLLLTWAGYLFNTSRLAIKETPASAIAVVDEDESQAFLESIVNVAKLASEPQRVESMLGGLTHVMSTMQRGKPLTEEERTELAAVYLKLESYLMWDDPLRTFTRQEIRQHVTPALFDRAIDLERAAGY